MHADPAAAPSVAVDPREGTAAFVRGPRSVRGIRAAAVVRIDGAERTLDLLRGATVSERRTVRGRSVVARVDQGGFATEWSLALTDGDHVASIEVAIIAAERPVRVEEIRALAAPWAQTHLAAETAAARWWMCPSSGWDRPGTRPLAGASHADDSTATAYDIAGAYAPSGAALTLGHPLPSRWINRLDADGAGVAVVAHVGETVPAHGSLRSDALLVDLDRPILAALAGMSARRRGRRRPVEAREHRAWSAWDFFTDKVTEADIDGALAALAARPSIGSKLRYVIVDDFWQELTGDWNPGARFGSIQRCAHKIAAAGFVPGIWTAPFFADRHSKLLREHPDYALRLDDGQLYAHCQGCDPPWGDRIFLDPTHPGVREHLFALYRRLHSWGFRYFKTDFLTDPIAHEFPGDRAKWRGRLRLHDQEIGVVRAHRACMEVIRAAIGPESFWLGCGSHFASGAGIMDATRVSGDMRVYFGNLLVCARSAIFNGHLHGGPFLNDPDFSIVRGRETTLPGGLELPAGGTRPYDRAKPDSGPTFDADEARLWAAVVGMSGGMITLSDKLDGLNETGLRIVETLLEQGGGEAAVPLDLFEPLPRRWLADRGDHRLLLLANWDDAPIELALPADAGIADGAETLDLWSGARSRYRAGERMPLRPHGHRWLRIPP